VASTSSSTEDAVTTELRKFSDVLRVARDDFVDSVDTHAMIVAGIQSMLAHLDPHSDFLPEDIYAKMTEEHRGSFFGVGMTISTQSGWLTVVSPIEGTPASRAGIITGDKIVAIDGSSTEGLSSDQAAELIRGPKGTKVALTIHREGEGDELEFELTRDEIPITSLPYSFFITPGIAYMRLTRFAKNSANEMDEALLALAEVDEIDAVLLDLRGNSGGLLTSAVDVADRFLDEEMLVVYTSGRIPRSNQKETAGGEGTWATLPLIVMVDRGSASASEIVAGAVQDWDRGLVVGRTTFGKGLVQNVYELSEGGALKITTARYYTPSGRSIQRDYSGTRMEYYRNAGQANGDSIRPLALSHGGRTLEGGGGIVPDVSLPNPRRPFRIEFEAQRKAVIFEEASRVLAAEPGLRTRFDSFDSFEREFTIEEELEDSLRAAMLRAGIQLSEENWNEAREYLLTALKAEIAGHIWTPTERHKVLMRHDDDIAKALEQFERARELLDPSFLPGRPDSAPPWPGEQLDIPAAT
jgi:carboxyl-terminal processing protease